MVLVAVAKEAAVVAANNIFASFREGDTLLVASATAPANDGTYTITSIADDFLGVTPAPATALAADTTFTVIRNYSGTYTINGVADGFIELTTSTFTGPVLGVADIDVVAFPPISEWTDWFAQPAQDRTQTWNNLVALQGMFKDNGGKSAATVEIEWQLERLDPSSLEPTGLVETFSGTLSGTVTQERAVTVEHATAWTGPCRIRGRRATPFDYDFLGTVMDEVTWVDLYSVSPVDKLHFDNKTTVQTITLATSRATATKERKLNLLATRLLPRIEGGGMSATFDAEGRVVSGTLYPTNRIADVLAAVALDPKIGNRQLAEVDLVQLAGVQALLDAWHPEMGQVNYTLDNDGMSFEETADLIANAGFCKAYRQSGKIRLAMDGPKAFSTGLWTHRNKAYPLQETVTRSFASDGDYDGVEFVYQDPDTESAETISLPLDRSAVRPKKFEIAGIRSFAQAWRRAQREYRKILGQRIAIETRCLTDARALLPFARVDIVDNTKFKSYDGEIISIDVSGLVLRLSQRVVFLPGEPHSIVLVRRNGSLQAITCTAGVDDQHVVLQSLPGEAIVPLNGSDPAKGVPTMFSFGPDSKRGAQAYSVQEVGAPKDGYVLVKAANYSPDFYADDTTDIPPSGSIIN